MCGKWEMWCPMPYLLSGRYLVHLKSKKNSPWRISICWRRLHWVVVRKKLKSKWSRWGWNKSSMFVFVVTWKQVFSFGLWQHYSAVLMSYFLHLMESIFNVHVSSCGLLSCFWMLKAVNSFMKLSEQFALCELRLPSIRPGIYNLTVCLMLDWFSFPLLGPVTWLWKLMLSYLQHPRVRSGGTSTSLKTATGEQPFLPMVARRRDVLTLFFLLKVYSKWEFTHDLPTTTPLERWLQSTKKPGSRFTWCVLN